MIQPADQYETLRGKLVTIVRRICPAWLADEAEDLVQECLIKLMQRDGRHGESPAGLTKAYLGRVAHSVLVDEIRRRKRRPVTAELDEEHAQSPGAMSEPAASPAHQQEVGAGITDCLARQNEDRRRALTLYLLGHTVPEAARILAWQVKRTENLVYRGLADLRVCLEEKGLRLGAATG